MIPSAIKHPTAEQAKFFADVRQRQIDQFLCRGESPELDEIAFPLEIRRRTEEARSFNKSSEHQEGVVPTAGGAAVVCFVVFCFLIPYPDLWPALVLSGGLGLLAAYAFISSARTTAQSKRAWEASEQAIIDVEPQLAQVRADWEALRKERATIAKRIRAEHKDLCARAGGFDLYIVVWFQQKTPAVYFETFDEVFSGEFAPYFAFLTRPVQTPKGERTLFECWVEERELDRAAGREVTLQEIRERLDAKIAERRVQEVREEEERERKRKKRTLTVFAEHKDQDEDLAGYLSARVAAGADE